jgi:hypothetical protein
MPRILPKKFNGKMGTHSPFHPDISFCPLSKVRHMRIGGSKS